jgi:integrase
MDHKYRPKFKAGTPAEAQSFLQAVRSDRLYALYAVALSMGLRRGEALGLRWADVDLADGVIRVQHGLHRVVGQLQLGPVKTDGSARVIPVPAPLLKVLRAHRRAQVEERQTVGQAWQDGGFVFTTGLGTAIEPRNINRHFDKLCASSGVRLHDLRHSCASLLWSQGVPLEQIQDILGHEDPRTTKTIYVDVAEELQRGAVDRLGFLFEETGE